jgi:hypothetical protein
MKLQSQTGGSFHFQLKQGLLLRRLDARTQGLCQDVPSRDNPKQLRGCTSNQKKPKGSAILKEFRGGNFSNQLEMNKYMQMLFNRTP